MDAFGLVVIGGSSGSHRALRGILADLPADLPAAVFVTTHMSAASNNMLASMLDGLGPLPVRTAEEAKSTGRDASTSPSRMPISCWSMER